ncbi:NYN domain-containing protein [candidate division WOR-3 bacterium]|nr:NYN domain-containing protein [candidate division WOR-3 bacterium]
MKKILIIDGYNILGRNPDSLFGEEERENLMSKVRALTSGSNFYTFVVFDGSGKTSSREKRPGVEIMFSSSEDSADELIVNLVEKSATAGQRVFVVTADRELSFRCKKFGALVFKDASLAVKKKKKPLKKDDKISPSESVDYWLKLFNKGDADEV